jgi:hypothetical protein
LSIGFVLGGFHRLVSGRRLAPGEGRQADETHPNAVEFPDIVSKRVLGPAATAFSERRVDLRAFAADEVGQFESDAITDEGRASILIG